MIAYYRLFDMLNRRGMKKNDLLEVATSPTIAKLSHNKPVSMETINGLCKFLHCQPENIMEYIEEKSEEEN